jgi:putative ABC transport system substrate-binding protein
MSRHKIFVVASVSAILLLPLLTHALQRRAFRIGCLSTTSSSSSPREALIKGLRELGYVHGQNIVIEWRYAEGNTERLPTLADELVRLRVDVLVAAGGTPPALAAKRATTTIPIVMTNVGDPVESGLVASLARPGGNITGLTSASPHLSGKRLELLKEVLPGLSRVAVLWNPANPSAALQFKETQAAARALGLQIQSLEARGPDDFEHAFGAAKRSGGILVVGDPMFTLHRTRLTDLAGRNRLPAMYVFGVFVEAGGLMSYGTSLSDLWRRAAYYVDKILRGAKPADLPVEQPTKFELVINLKTAKGLGVKIPAHLLMEADKVIE